MGSGSAGRPVLFLPKEKGAPKPEAGRRSCANARILYRAPQSLRQQRRLALSYIDPRIGRALKPLSRAERTEMREDLNYILCDDCPWRAVQHAAAASLCRRIMARFGEPVWENQRWAA